MRVLVRAVRRLRGTWRRRCVSLRPLGDAETSDYRDKLEGFARFAGKELTALAQVLGVAPGSRVLDAGCGTGAMLPIFQRQVGPGGLVVGLDLASAHLAGVRGQGSRIVQGNFECLPCRPAAFDVIWMANSLNHAADPPAVVARMREALSPGGVLAVVQSALLPDMMFAWDVRLERVVREACFRAYRDAYGLREADTAAIRRLVGLFREAGMVEVAVTTVVVERVSPLDPDDERYLRETVFDGYWGEKLRPYLARKDWRALSWLCDPNSDRYALRRPDFHHAQTLTLVRGRAPGPSPGTDAAPA